MKVYSDTEVFESEKESESKDDKTNLPYNN